MLDSRQYRKLHKIFKSKCIANDAHCWLCQQPIDYTIAAGDPEAFELDHLYPRSTHPEHALDPAGFRPSHKRCNASRGNKAPKARIGTPTRKWTK